MNHIKWYALMLSVVGLVACSESAHSPSEQGTASATEMNSAASSPLQLGSVNLRSADGKISVNTSGNFSDKLTETDLFPVNVDKDKLLLLQKDDITGTTIYVVKAGRTQHAADYFAKVKAAVESDHSLKNVLVGNASANRMSYQFSQVDKDGEITLNEQCVIVMDGENIYNVCANNPDASQEDLTAALSDITIVQP